MKSPGILKHQKLLTGTVFVDLLDMLECIHYWATHDKFLYSYNTIINGELIRLQSVAKNNSALTTSHRRNKARKMFLKKETDIMSPIELNESN
jgi:hypothetical protein